VNRCWFQKTEASKHRYAVILNLGCGEDPCEISSIPNTFVINIDLDMWKLPNFIQCDAHMLPIRDKSINVVVMGDVLEHLIDPNLVINEVSKVCKNDCEVIVTVPLEKTYRLGKERRLLEISLEGYSSFEEWKLKHPVFKGRCIKPLSDNLKPHTYHIHAFTEDQIVKMFEKHGFKPIKLIKHIELIDPFTKEPIPHLLAVFRKTYFK